LEERVAFLSIQRQRAQQPTTSLRTTTLPRTTSPTLHQPTIDFEVAAKEDEEEDEDEYAIESRYYEHYEEGREGEEDGRNVDLNM